MKRYFVTIVFSVIFSYASYGQGAFLQKGVSGLSIGGSFMTSSDATNFSGGVGYSIRGRFDIGLSCNRMGFEFIDNMAALSISPGITYHVLKQSERMPLSLSLGASYSYTTFSDSYTVGLYNIHGYSFSPGISLYRFFNISSIIRIQPTLGADYSHAYVEGETNRGFIYSSFDNSVHFGFGLPFIFDISSKYILAVSPRVRVGNETIVLGMALTFVFKIEKEVPGTE
jgi:hypothetical protein